MSDVETCANDAEGQLHAARVRAMFNDMAPEYDHLHDLWYLHTFGFIDRTIQKHLRPTRRLAATKPIALDVGCGTGIQSLRLASLGYQVIGIDPAERLLGLAQRKLRNAGFTDCEFLRGDATSLQQRSGSIDVVNCCGPTLSFVRNWRSALAEISRCLKPGGRLLLEVEGRWNFDAFWELLSAFFGNALHYNQSLTAAWGHIRAPRNKGFWYEYPFRLEDGSTVSMPLRLFTVKELASALRSNGLTPCRRWGIHSLTNIIPSPALHDAAPSWGMKLPFRLLARIETVINGHWPVNSFACSVLVLAQKGEAGPPKEFR